MKPRFLRILNKSAIAGLVGGLLSFLLPIIPCQKAAVVAEPEYKWGLCQLPNPFKQEGVGMIQKFFGFTTEPLTGLVLTFLIIFAIFLFVFLSIRRRAGKVLDLTRR